MNTLQWPLVRKEFRALVPWWGATAIMMLWCWALPRFELISVVFQAQFLAGGMIAYAAGALTLGAMSIGHEFNHVTLAAHLVQPATRTRLLVAKWVTLGAMLAALVGLAALTTAQGIPRYIRPEQILWFTLFPVALGLGLAPWLTMLCRGRWPAPCSPQR